jgi:release factor glutamine methyltransferase
VPRPETELLVDKALAALKGRADARILDLGTGTGCIPISILANAPGITAVATDLSSRALEAAGENAQRHAVAERLVLLEGSWFEPLDSASRVTSPNPNPPLQGEGTASGPFYASAGAGGPKPLPLEGRGWGGGKPRQSANPQHFDLIVSNPPYIESAEISGLAPEVRDHDPVLALDGGPDGLVPYRIIARQAPRHLRPGGILMVEIGSGQGEAVAALLAEAGFERVEIDKDLAGLDRVVSGHHLHP